MSDNAGSAPAPTIALQFDVLMDAPQTQPQPQPANHLQPLSYRDKLLLEEKSSGISFATIPSYLEEDSDVDDDPENEVPIILLSKAEKRRIREPWANSLIIKAFAPKPVGYNFLYPRIKAQWKPLGKWDFIDLGNDFFLVRLQDEEDLKRVIFGGPWFVGPYYLTIRRWEPNFDPMSATFSTTAIWARLPHLSADHYDPITLEKIGNKIGTLLRVDAHTAHHTRGQYARVCAQVDLGMKLVHSVRIGKKFQKVVYEGVDALCFSCGRIGHRRNQCLSVHHKATSSQSINIKDSRQCQSSDENGSDNRLHSDSHIPSPSTSEDSMDLQLSDRVLDQYEPWMLVERRKPRRNNRKYSNSDKPEPSTLVNSHIPMDKNELGAPTRKHSLKGPTGPQGSKSIQANGKVSEAFNEKAVITATGSSHSNPSLLLAISSKPTSKSANKVPHKQPSPSSVPKPIGPPIGPPKAQVYKPKSTNIVNTSKPIPTLGMSANPPNLHPRWSLPQHPTPSLTQPPCYSFYLTTPGFLLFDPSPLSVR
ncbi:hypothetical protein SLEP1_g56012 [Rubroshorea leprosula]|uniref:CCHC-type domain-containing protein n=1 Tax=Rubroshorea leprosula TaxID=152421 RepID=A0AAV5MH39_9ROSI|nr:hypothetical protein SLEP1_g56012 [Rubroshorea leprosula]